MTDLSHRDYVDNLLKRIAELEKALRYIADEGDENWYTPMTDIAIDIARKALGKEIDE